METLPLFVYGTLLIPEFVSKVIGRVPPFEPASLEGYSRYRMRGKRYPGLCAEPGGRTLGGLISGLIPTEFVRLDAYEGDEYQRHQVRVVAAGQLRTAFVYLVRDVKLLSREPWELDPFLKDEVEAFRSGEFLTLLGS